MGSVRVRWSAHVLGRMQRCEIEPLWVERVVANPERVAVDPNHQSRFHQGRFRAFGRVPERNDRVLRVVYEPLQADDEILVITALLDRGRTRTGRRTR